MLHRDLPAGVAFAKSELGDRFSHYWEQRTRVSRGIGHGAATLGAEAAQHLRRFAYYLTRGDEQRIDAEVACAVSLARLAGRRWIGEVLWLQAEHPQAMDDLIEALRRRAVA